MAYFIWFAYKKILYTVFELPFTGMQCPLYISIWLIAGASIGCQASYVESQLVLGDFSRGIVQHPSVIIFSAALSSIKQILQHF